MRREKAGESDSGPSSENCPLFWRATTRRKKRDFPREIRAAEKTAPALQVAALARKPPRAECGERRRANQTAGRPARTARFFGATTRRNKLDFPREIRAAEKTAPALRVAAFARKPRRAERGERRRANQTAGRPARTARFFGATTRLKKRDFPREIRAAEKTAPALQVAALARKPRRAECGERRRANQPAGRPARAARFFCARQQGAISAISREGSGLRRRPRLHCRLRRSQENPGARNAAREGGRIRQRAVQRGLPAFFARNNKAQ